MPYTVEPTWFDWISLAADVATPLAVVGLGAIVSVVLARFERSRKQSEIETSWRLEVFRELIGHLNDLHCYFTYQGKWRSMSPDDASTAKQSADRVIYVNEFLWSREFLSAYKSFVAVAFLENRGKGRTFLLRANVARHRENSQWDEAWADRFVVESERVCRTEFVERYSAMVLLAVRDLGIVSNRQSRRID